MFSRIFMALITSAALALATAAHADTLTRVGAHEALFDQAEAALSREDAGAALMLLTRDGTALRRDGDIARHAALRCMAFHQLGEFAAAAAACGEAIDTRAANWSDYNNRGAARLLMGDSNGALQDFRRANQLRPGLALVRKNIARAIRMTQKESQLAINR